jgi:hypothetical protein
MDISEMKEIQDKIDRFLARSDEYDHTLTHEAVCPWCGYEHVDSWEFRDNDTANCHECENGFKLERIVTVQYTTERSGEDEHKKWYEERMKIEEGDARQYIP